MWWRFSATVSRWWREASDCGQENAPPVAPPLWLMDDLRQEMLQMTADSIVIVRRDPEGWSYTPAVPGGDK